jgi:hypothetical protein
LPLEQGAVFRADNEFVPEGHPNASSQPKSQPLLASVGLWIVGRDLAPSGVVTQYPQDPIQAFSIANSNSSALVDLGLSQARVDRLPLLVGGSDASENWRASLVIQ